MSNPYSQGVSHHVQPTNPSPAIATLPSPHIPASTHAVTTSPRLCPRPQQGQPITPPNPAIKPIRNPYSTRTVPTVTPLPKLRQRKRFRRRHGPPKPNPTQTPVPPSFQPKEDAPSSRPLAEVLLSNLKENKDFGDVLQQLLQADDLGLMLQYISADHSLEATETWKHQVLRIYFQNINGLRLGDEGADIVHVLLQMYNIGAGIFAFNETKTNCMDPKIRRLLDACKGKIWDRRNQQCRIFTCSSELPWASKSKPGGILIGFSGPIVGRTKMHFPDKYGRWLRVDLLGRDGKTLSVICAYQVAQDTGTHGNTTTYQQRVMLMRLDGIEKPNPKKNFIQDLSTLVKQLRKDKHDVILMGDFNESIGVKPELMASVMLAGDLTDTFTYLHRIDAEKPTYVRGTKRIDYILVSPRLLQHLKRSGAEAFNFRIHSDHRGIWADFSLPGFFDRAPNALAKPNARPFIYDAPNHVKRYLEKTNKYFIQHDILHRLCELLDQEGHDDAIAESLDDDITRAMLSAADSMKSATREPWSEALHNAMTTLYILLKHLSQLKTDFDGTKAICDMQLKLPIPIALPTSVDQTNAAVRAARRVVRQVVQKASDLSKLREQDKIKARQLANPDADPEKVEKQYFQAQVSRELFRAVPSAKPAVSGGISTVEVPLNPLDDPKADGTLFQSIREPNAVEETIIVRNEKHFSQAKEAPLAQPSVTAKLSFSGTTSIADQLLAGTADIDAITPDRFSRALLRHCKRKLPEALPAINLETLQSAYRHWPVGTSTSPSGRTLSHQHLLFQAHGVAKGHPDNGPLEESREANWEAQAGIVQYAIRHGYCFRRWCQVVNAMLEKEQGNPKLHRLRVIHLYESDYNAVLGIKLREVMHQCEDHEVLHLGAYGSRANRQSLDPVFIEVLQYDYASLTRWPEIKFGNDTSSCYDRHVPSVSNIILRSLGLHRNIANIHGTMLENAIYRIKTQLGISKKSYSHSLSSPVFGMGQGSKASPPVWATLCSSLFNMYDAHCWGANYYDMSGSRHLKLGMTGFVDDNACNVNCQPHEIDSLVARATHDSQLWNDILWGGSQILEPPKCCFHQNETEFTSTGAPLFRTGQFGDPIIISDSNGKRVKLKQLSAYMPYKTLGTWQSVGKTQKIQFDELQKKSSKLSCVLALSSCSGNAAWLYFSSVFQKGIGYPLADALHQTAVSSVGPWTASLRRARVPLLPSQFGASFSEHIAALPDHQSLLLERVDLLGNDIFNICHTMAALDDIVVVSDGGAMAEYGSYGWVISTADGERLAQGSGTVFGYDPRSYRAEGYGAKASTLFILEIFKYCDRTMPNGTFSFYCDNKGVLRKLEKMRSYSQAIFATCLHSEWDIISSIHRMHQEFSELPVLDHVRGHQDSNTMKCMLPLPAQLNIEADALATTEMMERGSIKPTVPFDPAVGVMIRINRQSVTRNIESSIRQHLHIAPIRQYYRDRFQWSVDTIDAIDWETFAMVYTKYARTRTFFTKFGWKKLPVGNRLHERSPSYDHRCPCCHHDHEQDDHVFQCTTAFHADWQYSLFTRLSDRFGQFLDPDLMAILRIGLTSYFQGIPVDFSVRFPLGYSSTPYAQLIEEQTAIGWDHFFRGKLSCQWHKLQYYYAKCYGLLTESAGWLVSLIRMLSVSAFALWDHRNGCRHGRDSATKFVKSHEQAQREVRELYLKRDLVLDQDKNLFWDSVELHVKEPYTVLANWLQINRKFITFSVRQAKAKAKKHTDKLSTYFAIVRRSVSTLRTRPQSAAIPSGTGHPTASRQSKSRCQPKPRPQAAASKSPYYNTYLTRHFEAKSPSRSTLPVIVEEPLSLSSPHSVHRAPNQLRDPPRPRPRQRCLYHFFPDHPG